jgi:hypothetical protein
MRHKYVLLRDDDKKELLLREMGEIDREIFALLCEEAYGIDTLNDAVSRKGDALVRTLRTDNIFPLGRYAEKIATAVGELLENGIKEVPMEKEKKEFYERLEEKGVSGGTS